MLAVIRIRGTTGITPSARKTAELLRLNKINHLVLIEDNDVYRGMLKQVKDYVTWGEIDGDTLEILLKNRATFTGNRKISEEDLKEETGFQDYKDMASALLEGKLKFKEINNVVPVIRLNPPYRGYEAIRKSVKQKGSSGYRGPEINKLIRRMITPGVDLNGKKEN